MTRLFADNVGLVSMFEKDVAIPAGIEVIMGDSLEAIKFSCFVTGFSSNKKTQYQLKKSLDHKTHIIPFGEAPEMISVSGITFGFQQLPGGPNAVKDYRIKILEGRKAGAATVGAEAPDITGEEKTLKVPSWVTDIGGTVVSAVVGNVLSSLSGLAAKVGGLLKAVGAVMTLVSDILAVPGKIVAGILEALGFSEADPQTRRTISANIGLTPLSFPEMNILFDVMQVGSTTRVAKNMHIVLSYCGVQYNCAIESIEFQADEAKNIITFTMGLLCLEEVKYYTAIGGEKPVRTRATSVFGEKVLQASQAIGQAGMSAVRSSGASVGPVSVGRLLG